MSSAKTAPRVATCPNVTDCSLARAHESVEWYAGPGEYCPVCGERLTPSAAAAPQTVARSSANLPLAPLRVPATRSPWRRWFWIVTAALVAGALLVYFQRRPIAAQHMASQAIEVCAIPSAQQLALDLVHSYAVKSRLRVDRFIVRNGSICDVRFSSAAATPEAVVARDGIVAIVNPLNPISRISEVQLWAIYTGSITNWSQLGGQQGKIVALLPADTFDEAKTMKSSLFLGAVLHPSVRREGSSVDVMRAVAGADRAGRESIGLVAFSQSVPAKVVPLAYLPAPSVLTIATRRYPYTLTIGVATTSDRADPDATRFVDYVRSADGAQVVARNGLINRDGL